MLCLRRLELNKNFILGTDMNLSIPFGYLNSSVALNFEKCSVTESPEIIDSRVTNALQGDG